MTDQLQLAGEQLQKAWIDYHWAYLRLKHSHTRKKPPFWESVSQDITQPLDTELALISILELNIRDIKLSISRFRNEFPRVRSINSLPPEILLDIFHLVLAQPCKLERLADMKAYDPRYPDCLAQVCRLWRRIATSCSPLWCHIDISPHKPYYDRLIARAETHVARAGRHPIDLHIAVDYNTYHGDIAATHSALYSLIVDISGRVESLELAVAGDFGSFHGSLFSSFLIHEHPNLTKLVIKSTGEHNDNFIKTGNFDPSELDAIYEDFELGISNDQLESSFAPLTVLHLRGIFPLWSSKAYHGLVDLRLMSTNVCSSIEQLELITILKSSPALRILYFGLSIEVPTPNPTETTPIALAELQVVKVFSAGHRRAYPDRLLPLLAPGSRPLELYYGGCEPTVDFLTELDKFFTRSRVRTSHIWGMLPPMRTLLRHPYLEQVVLEHSKISFRFEITSTWLDVGDMASLPRLRALHITDSSLFDSELYLFVESCPANTALHHCHIIRDQEDDSEEELTATELLDLFPNIRTTSTPLYLQRDPVADWNVLD